MSVEIDEHTPQPIVRRVSLIAPETQIDFEAPGSYASTAAPYLVRIFERPPPGSLPSLRRLALRYVTRANTHELRELAHGILHMLGDE